MLDRPHFGDPGRSQREYGVEGVHSVDRQIGVQQLLEHLRRGDQPLLPLKGALEERLRVLTQRCSRPTAYIGTFVSTKITARRARFDGLLDHAAVLVPVWFATGLPCRTSGEEAAELLQRSQLPR